MRERQLRPNYSDYDGLVENPVAEIVDRLELILGQLHRQGIPPKALKAAARGFERELSHLAEEYLDATSSKRPQGGPSP